MDTTTTPTTIERAAQGAGYGIGRSFLGPLAAGAIDSPDMRSASMSLGFRVGLSAGVGLALVYLLRRAFR